MPRVRAPQSPRRIHSAARSAIISVGALVLPLVIVGMTLASTTRRPRHAVDAQARVDDAPSGRAAGPILAVPTGWKMVVPMSPASVRQVGVALELRPRA